MRLLAILSPTNKWGDENRVYKIEKVFAKRWIYKNWSGSLYENCD